MDFLQALILAIVEGLTEFLPVSSTAHMIFTSAIFQTEGDEFVKLFQVSIQFGAILSVVALYWKKFFDFTSFNFYFKLAMAVVPALILGKLFDEHIEKVLESPLPIAIVLIIGGVVLLFVDKLFTQTKIDNEEKITVKKAIAIGFWQCLAMMPGTSRSAASIIGGMQQGLTRRMAAEFSFFLAVPTMLAVTMYSLFLKNWQYKGEEQKGYEMILSSSENIANFAIGNVVAFIVAGLAIKLFIGLIDKFGFKIWGWYRIILGAILVSFFILRDGF
jgi:undecaprenyl-diphosphatase